jgi:hypothetical protein
MDYSLLIGVMSCALYHYRVYFLTQVCNHSYKVTSETLTTEIAEKKVRELPSPQRLKRHLTRGSDTALESDMPDPDIGVGQRLEVRSASLDLTSVMVLQVTRVVAPSHYYLGIIDILQEWSLSKKASLCRLWL